jgi:RNA polymerase primary sigma factor
VKIDSSLAWYIEKLKEIAPPQQGEEALLIHHAKEGNIYAKERLITMFLKVALRIALWHHEKFKFPLAETIQDANIGLILALEKFPIEKNIRFSTYAPWWIRQYIVRQTQGFSNIFYSLPVHTKEKLIVILKIRSKYDYECSECESFYNCFRLHREIMDQINCDMESAVNYLNLLQTPINIEELVTENYNLSYVYNESNENILENVYKNELTKQLNTAFSKLKEKECFVLNERFGLIDGEPKTLETVGTMLGVTRERVRQIESRALKRLKKLSDLKLWFKDNYYN